MDTVIPANSEPPLHNDETMSYRAIGKTGLNVSALSMGCMRLGEDQELNTRVVSRAVELGVNYFETARWYCGGQCQQRTAPGIRQKANDLIVSGKCGIDKNTTEYSYLKEIEYQLKILDLTHFKFFQVGWFSWEKVPHLLKRGGALGAVRKAMEIGLVHHTGFTGHDTPENFIKCIETGLFDSLTVPYNLINRTYEPTIKRAGELGIGVVAMCPVGGGTLSFESQKIREVLDMDLPTTEVALRFVLSNPAVSTACSGMSTIEMVEQNVRTAKSATGGDPAFFSDISKRLDRITTSLGGKICTGCRYCMPCPQGVDIPRYMDIYRLDKGFGLHDWALREVENITQEQRANRCNKCGICETRCPNSLLIRDIIAIYSIPG